MWLLLEGSNISESEKRLVLIEVNFTNRTTIFQDTKNSMKKLFTGLMEEKGTETRVISESFYTNQRGGGNSGGVYRGAGGYNRGRGGYQTFRGRGAGGFNPRPYAPRQSYQPQRFPTPQTARGGGASQTKETDFVTSAGRIHTSKLLALRSWAGQHTMQECVQVN